MTDTIKAILFTGVIFSLLTGLGVFGLTRLFVTLNTETTDSFVTSNNSNNDTEEEATQKTDTKEADEVEDESEASQTTPAPTEEPQISTPITAKQASTNNSVQEIVDKVIIEPVVEEPVIEAPSNPIRVEPITHTTAPYTNSVLAGLSISYPQNWTMTHTIRSTRDSNLKKFTLDFNTGSDSLRIVLQPYEYISCSETTKAELDSSISVYKGFYVTSIFNQNTISLSRQCELQAPNQLITSKLVSSSGDIPYYDMFIYTSMSPENLFNQISISK